MGRENGSKIAWEEQAQDMEKVPHRNGCENAGYYLL